jgi:replicative DNA helicase
MEKRKNQGNDYSVFFDEENNDPFDISYQNRFLKIFFSDKTGFGESLIDILDVNHFDLYQKMLINYALKYFADYKDIPRFEILKDIIRQKEKGLNQDYLLDLVSKVEGTVVENIPGFKDGVREFFKSKSIKNCIKELVTDWKNHSYDAMIKRLSEAIKAGEVRDYGHDYITDIEKRLNKDFRNPVPALAILDKYIGGGLAAGELGVVLAPPGGGKSMMLVALACYALLSGKKIVYYTLELSEEAVGQRFDACLNDIKLKEVWDFPDIIEEKLAEIKSNNGSLKIKKFGMGQASVNTLLTHIRHLESNEGFVPDEILIDYADLMKPTVNYTEKRHTLTHIYEALRGDMAEVLHIPIWTASQTSKAGFNVEKFGLDVFGEATIGKAATADVVIGVARPEEFKTQKLPMANISILKNRNGQDGIHFSAIFDTSRVKVIIIEAEPSLVIQKDDKRSKKRSEPKEEVDENDISSILLGD